MKEADRDTAEELDILHSAVMALESVMIEKGLFTVEELNAAIESAYRECKKARAAKKSPVMARRKKRKK